MPNGAQLIVDLLEAQDVEVCFGLPGVRTAKPAFYRPWAN